MSKWIPLDEESLNLPSDENINGVNITVFASPYDIPEAVRGEFDHGMNRFVIQFKYPTGEEPLTVGYEGDLVRIMVGRRSRRIHRIELDIASMDVDHVGLNVLENRAERAIEKLVSQSRTTDARHFRGQNYLTARRAIGESPGRQVFAEMTSR